MMTLAVVPHHYIALRYKCRAGQPWDATTHLFVM